MDEIAIKINNLSKAFKLPHERQSSIKSMLLNVYKRKKGYELQQALSGVSFEINKGDFFAIVGRNGSGKSTLLKMMAGIYVPTKGGIFVNGRLTPFIELGVGFNPELTGRENIFLSGALLGFNRKEMNAMYHDIVKFAELEKFMDQKLKNYSSGMYVRLAFSIAIRAESDILLIDEVLAVGDAAFQQKCFNYFEELRQEKKTVVFVSHDMGAVTRFCNKAVYLKDGKLTHSGTPLEVADIYMQENIEDANRTNLDSSIPKKKDSRIKAKIKEEKGEEVKLEYKFETKYTRAVYIATSLMKDGTSIAEIITRQEMKLKGKGKVSYTLNTSIFNNGVYQVSSALCKAINRECLAFSEDKPLFLIKGHDESRGGAIKLPHSWKKES
jgi:ABC-2 type transport system ATP-binding protein